MLTEKGTRTAILTTANISTLNSYPELHSKYAPKVCPATAASTAPGSLPAELQPPAQQSRAGTGSEPAWAQATPGPVLVTPRALALPELPHRRVSAL